MKWGERKEVQLSETSTTLLLRSDSASHADGRELVELSDLAAAQDEPPLLVAQQV